MSDQEQTRENHISLVKYFESRIQSLEKATEVAKQSMDRRLDGMNEFRQSLNDQASRTLSSTEYHQAHKTLEDRISRMELSNAERIGEARSAAMMSGAISSIVVGIVTAIILHFAFR